jgi:predicted MFS family arabinose efflux permease
MSGASAEPSSGSPAPQRGAARRRLAATFAAMRYRNYRLWFTGQVVSLLGTWMQITAQGYLVFELTRSTAYLGYVGFASGVPTWLFTLYGGVIADRVSRRGLLIVTQSVMMLLALALAVLTFTGHVRPWHIVGLALLHGTANAFDAPARQSFVVELVEREDLTNAIALNSTMFNIGTTVGPAIGGVVYAALGPSWCFAVNGVSFLAVIAALAAMRLPPRAPQRSGGSAVRELVEGLRFVAGHRMVRTLITGIAVTSVFGFSVMTLMPAWSTTILGGDARTNGLLLSARGLGSVVAAMLVASAGRGLHRGQLNLLGSFLTPVVLLAFAVERAVPAALITLALAGWGFMAFFNTTNALVQELTPDALRGRVMGLYSLSFFGLVPLGALRAGGAAAHVGEPATVIAGALVLLGYAALRRWRMPEVSELR